MDKYTKSVYKFLLNQPGYGFQTGFYDPEGFDKAAFICACEALVRMGYAKQTKHGFALLHEGIHKRELAFIHYRKEFIFTFLSGIATGVIATVLSQLLLLFLRAKLGL